MQQQQQQQQQGLAGGVYSNGQPLPNSLLLLPLYAMSLQKSLVLRGGTDVRIDERAFYQLCVLNFDVEETKVFVYPRLFSLHDMPSDAGLPCDNVDAAIENGVATAGKDKIRLPAILNLSYERLSSTAIVLLENGCDLFLWVGRGANPALLSTLFNTASLEGVDVSKLKLVAENSDFSMRVSQVVEGLRQERAARYLQLHIIKEGDGFAEAYFARFLVEDR